MLRGLFGAWNYLEVYPCVPFMLLYHLTARAHVAGNARHTPTRLHQNNVGPSTQKQQAISSWTMDKAAEEFSCHLQRCLHQEKAGANKHCTAGYRMFRADKVDNVLLNPGDCVITVKADVQASFSLSKYYAVHAVICYEGSVESGHCTCRAGGGGVCKHVAAVLWFLLDVRRMGHHVVPNTLSCTEEPRQWGTRKKPAKVTCENFLDLSFVKHVPGKLTSQNRRPAVEASKVAMTSSALQALSADLDECQMSPMLSALIKESNYEARPKDTVCRPLTTQEMRRISIPLHVLPETCCKHFAECAVTLEEAYEIEEKTWGQSSTPLWYHERSNRITASRFGEIVKCRAPVTEKFSESIFSSRRTPVAKHMRVGMANESAALARYTAAKDVTVRATGLCVNPGIPILGASPDGLVWDGHIQEYGLVEVKTLSKAMEDQCKMEELVTGNKVPFLNAGELKKNHNFYFQIQGQLALAGLRWCDLVADCGDELFIERVAFNEDVWKKMVLCLVDFHNKYFKEKENHCQ